MSSFVGKPLDWDRIGIGLKNLGEAALIAAKAYEKDVELKIRKGNNAWAAR